VSKKVFLLIIAGLCFGQSTESIPSYNYSLKIPRSMFVKPISQEENLILHNLRAHSLQFNMTSFNTMLMMQVEGESLQPKTSFWKQAGIYGLEYAGADAGSCASLYMSLLFWNPENAGEGEEIVPMFVGFGVYVVSNPLLTSSFTSFVAKKFNQNGSWKKALIGSSFGAIASFFANAIYYQHASSRKAWVSFMFLTAITLPPTGAVVGYNW